MDWACLANRRTEGVVALQRVLGIGAVVVPILYGSGGGEFIDEGYWSDLQSGQIPFHKNVSAIPCSEIHT